MATKDTCCEFEYCAQQGDTYASVARRFAIGARALQAHNGGAQMSPGDTIRIPCAHGCCTMGRFYVIKRGDTLSRIAARTGVDMVQLLAANPYLNPAYYIPGQVIVLPKKRTVQQLRRYTLGPEDGLVSVLKKFHMDVTTFCALNPGLCPMDARPGMSVNVSGGIV